MFRIYFCIACVLVSACERDGPAPVRMGIDDDFGGMAVTSSARGDSQSYRVKEGETLFDIAYKFSIDPMNLAQINHIKPPYDVDTGQVLRLPRQNVGQDFSQQEPERKKPDQQLDSEFAGMLAASAPATSAATSKGTVAVSEKAVTTGKPKDGTAVKSKPSEAKSAATDGKSATSASKASSAEKASATSGNSEASGKSKDASKAVVKEPSLSGRWITPVQGKIVSRFGEMTDGVANDGIDIAAPLGTPVKAVAGGKVIYAGNGLSDEYKNVVLIDHGVHKDARLISSSALLKDIKVKKGMQVKAGDIIGTVGKGDHGSQLHFEIMKQTGHDAVPLNPSTYIGF